MSLAIIRISPKLVWKRGSEAWANREGAESNYGGWCDYKLSVGEEAASAHFQFCCLLFLRDEAEETAQWQEVVTEMMTLQFTVY